jgi:D-alanyl-D-alanine carboxypeptidase
MPFSSPHHPSQLFFHFMIKYLWLPCAVVLLSSLAAELPESFDAAAVDRYLSSRVDGKRIVGASVTIVRDGQTVLTKGYGLRSIEEKRPVETNTLFAIGSVTKQFTCAAILLLAEEGKLSVHDAVAKYYPKLTRANEITLLDLMNNVSGYTDYYPLDFIDRRMRAEIEPDELLRQYAGAKLDFEPGTKYSYSNTGFVLLGRVVENVSGQRFGDFLTKRILAPLGMTQTFYDLDGNEPLLAVGYATFALSDPEPESLEAKGWIGPAGGIISTPSDLAKWNLALIDGKVLRADSYGLMTKARRLKDGRRSDYGCGLGLGFRGGREVLEHTGAVGAFTTYNAVVPSTRSSVTVCVNMTSGAPDLGRELIGLLLKVLESVPEISGPPAAEAAKALLAQYQSGTVERSKFTPEFNEFLTKEKLAGAAKRLKGFGSVKKAEVLSRGERGGMEVTTTRLECETGELRALMYRHADGKIAQFFIYPR